MIADIPAPRRRRLVIAAAAAHTLRLPPILTGDAVEQQIQPALAEMQAQPPWPGPGRAAIPPPWQGLAGGLLELLKKGKR